MNCNIFKKRLEDYVLGNIPSDLKIALENHMDDCESCRMIYEEEFKLDKAFKMVLSIDGIEFNSSRTSIINEIDKNRYSKKTSNKILYNFKRHRNKYLSYMVAAIAMIVFIPIMVKDFSGQSYTEKASDDKVAIYKAGEESMDATIKEKDTMEAMDDTKEGITENFVEDKMATNNVKLPMEFKSTIVSSKELPDYEMVWEDSADGNKAAAIDTSEEQDVDFGIHVIYVKNVKTNEIVKHEVINNDAQYTPRNIEWWDNDHLIVVTGFGYGTVAHGLEVYSLDVNTDVFTTLHQIKDEKYQILEVEKVEDDLILQLKIYEDSNYNNSHKGVGKMTLLELNKLVDMKILSEEKK